MRTMRWIAALTALLALTLVQPLAAGAQAPVRYWLQVVGDDGTAITSGYCRPLNAGLNTEPTIYTSATLGTAKSIPITINAVSGECEWYQTRGRTYDVLVYVTGGKYKGSVGRLLGFTGVDRAVVSQSATLELVVPFPATASASYQTASETFSLGGLLIQDVIVETKTAVAGSTFLVSYAGALDGRLCASVPTDVVGFADCNPTRLMLHAGSALAVTWNNQNHASAGYIHVFGKPVGNMP